MLSRLLPQIVILACFAGSAALCAEETRGVKFGDLEVKREWDTWPSAVHEQFAPYLSGATITKAKHDNGSLLNTALLLLIKSSPNRYQIRISSGLDKGVALKLVTSGDRYVRFEFDEMKIKTSDLPPAVTRAAAKQVPDCQWENVSKVKKEVDWPLPVCQLKGTAAGKRIKLKLAADGSRPEYPLESVLWAQVPVEVRATAIRLHPEMAEQPQVYVGAWKLEAGKRFYRFIVRENGADAVLKVFDDGSVYTEPSAPTMLN